MMALHLCISICVFVHSCICAFAYSCICAFCISIGLIKSSFHRRRLFVHAALLMCSVHIYFHMMIIILHCPICDDHYLKLWYVLHCHMCDDYHFTLSYLGSLSYLMIHCHNRDDHNLTSLYM